MKKILYFGLLAISINAFAQKQVAQDDALVALGDELFHFGDKKDARDLYLQALEMNPNHLKANYMIGRCYLETTEKKKAVPYFLKAFEINKEVSPDIMYKIAASYHYGAEFDNAMKYYRMHEASLNPTKLETMRTTLQEERAKCDKKIFECMNGKIYYANPKDYPIQNIGLPVNSEYHEYAVAITADQSTMIFTSRREGGIGQNKDVDNEFFEDIWITTKSNNQWTPPRNLGKNINTLSHDASIGFSPDGKKLFIYKSENGGDIFYSDKINDTTWSIPKNIGPIINSKFTETSVSISHDGKNLFFSSDRPGGFGKMDIYKAELDQNGVWGKPYNLGSKINTIYDEDSPFMDLNEKTLYFSSRGMKSMGGYDIYKSTYDKEKFQWSEAENLGYPLNSPDDDIYFVISGDGKTGYYASAKEGGMGENDIYAINMERTSVISEYKKSKLDLALQNTTNETSQVLQIGELKQITVVKGKITDETSQQPLVASIKMNDIKTLQNVSLANAKPDGSYEITITSGFDYLLEVEKLGYFYYSEQVKIPYSDKFQSISKDVSLKKLTKGSKIILKNVFFDVGVANLRDESKLELELLYELLRTNPNLKIEVSGHSDNVGADASNLQISKDRAQQVYNYLINKGIKSERLRYAGYGKEKPIASNETEAGRQQNRRTEFEIISD